MSVGFHETTLEWGLGARPLSLTSGEWPITGPYMHRSGFACHVS